MALTLTSISPVSGPPGTAITLDGTGFDPSSRAACPAGMATTLLSATRLTAVIPANAVPGAVAVYVAGPGGNSAPVIFVVTETLVLAAYTTVDAVVAEVSGFKRGGLITDAQIGAWIESVGQACKGALLRRGLPLDQALWQTGAGMEAVDVLEMINRLGAAARLASAVSAQFSAAGRWALEQNLNAAYEREMKALQAGDYDKLFRPGAATVESGPLLSAGDMTNGDGSSSAAFSKGKVF